MEGVIAYHQYKSALKYLTNLKRLNTEYSIKHFSLRIESIIQLYYSRIKRMLTLRLPYVIPDIASYCACSNVILINGANTSICYLVSLTTNCITHLEQYPICISSNSLIYASAYKQVVSVGGNIKGIPTGQCYAYCFRSRSWKKLPSINHARSNSSLCIINDSLYLIGGIGRTVCCSIEKHSMKKPERDWEVINNDIKHSIIRFTAYNYINKEIILFGQANNEIKLLTYTVNSNTVTEIGICNRSIKWLEYSSSGSIIDGSIYVLNNLYDVVKIHIANKQISIQEEQETGNDEISIQPA